LTETNEKNNTIWGPGADWIRINVLHPRFSENLRPIAGLIPADLYYLWGQHQTFYKKIDLRPSCEGMTDMLQTNAQINRLCIELSQNLDIDVLQAKTLLMQSLDLVAHSALKLSENEKIEELEKTVPHFMINALKITLNTP